MKVLIVGDVHGCYHTFRKLVKEHWNPQEEILIQIGDLVNKGLHSAECVQYAMKLEKEYPGKVVFLKGNHENYFCGRPKTGDYAKCYKRFKRELKAINLDKKVALGWMESLPLKWENDELFISHAGIGKTAVNPYDVNSQNSILTNRLPVKRIGKIQVKGHTLIGNKPLFKVNENAWYIDTGAWYKKYLSALRFTQNIELPEIIRQEVSAKDRESTFSEISK